MPPRDCSRPSTGAWPPSGAPIKRVLGRPLVVNHGRNWVTAWIRHLYDAAQLMPNPEMLVYLALHEGLLDLGDERMPPNIAKLASRTKPVELRGAHLSVLAKLVPAASQARPLDRLRSLYAIKTVIEDASYSNELKLVALAGPTLLRASQSKDPAEREAAGLGLVALVGQLLGGKLYREVEAFAQALLDTGTNADLALAFRYAARLVTRPLELHREPEVLRAARPGQFETFCAQVRQSAADALLLMAKGKDPSLRRLKKDVPRWSTLERRQFRAASEKLRERA